MTRRSMMGATCAVLLVGVAVVGGLPTRAATTPPADSGVNAPPVIVPPIERGAVAGVTPGDWTARWWRWAMSQHVAPYRDPDGRLCEIGQQGPVWFLAGTTGTFAAQRRCVVPEGRHLLVPIINMVYWQPSGTSVPCAELQADAAVNNDRLLSAVVVLDGQSMGDMRRHRVRTDGCFRMVPSDAGSRLGAADGYWLMLKPLARGRHTLEVGANYGPSGTGYGGMVQNFSYVIDVGGPSLLGDARDVSGRRHARPVLSWHRAPQRATAADATPW